jgi:hypothetical protein
MADVSDDVVHVIGKLLPKVAERFQNQKGLIFGLGDDGSDTHCVLQMDEKKLENAPIHNLDAERNVGLEFGKRAWKESC